MSSTFHKQSVGAKLSKTSHYSIAIDGCVYECRTGRYLFEIPVTEAFHRQKMGGPRLDRWVEKMLRETGPTVDSGAAAC